MKTNKADVVLGMLLAELLRKKNLRKMAKGFLRKIKKAKNDNNK